MSTKPPPPRTPRSTPKPGAPPGPGARGDELGAGGELHQRAAAGDPVLTTNQGLPIADDQSSLTAGPRGPVLLEDFVLREKITHFDHERIPERIVHARGTGAHGYFQCYRSLAGRTRAKFLQDPATKTPVFCRFSTVAGGAGSVDTPRDVRGFAVKFYTAEGVFDLVGNNIPVFFIQDAMKFPDLIHAVKMEPDRGFPQAGSAHDTFWDFASLMPESMHMLMWAMSDRTIPRSLRMIQGFGVHSFRLVDSDGKSTFVKFHWRPVLGAASTTWDEACKLAGADPDFQRRDLWGAIDRGEFPAWELSIQAFDQATADGLDFDFLDPTKLIPEELIPLEPIGKMVLDRNPDNFFAETEQVAFCPANVVSGIDFTNDPLLQGRLFSYLDTQLSRLGGPNFHELPINRSQCPMHNFQRDGHMRMEVPKGRVAYEPSSLGRAEAAPRETASGFASFPAADDGAKGRIRPESFADHYSQARLFWRSMTAPEQRHIVGAFSFELAKVETAAIRRRMLGHLAVIDPELGEQVADRLGLADDVESIVPAVAPRELPPSPALSLIVTAKPTLVGRTVAVLVTDGSDRATVDALRAALAKEGARLVVVAPRIAGVKADDGTVVPADHELRGAPSCLWDAVVVAIARAGQAALLDEGAAVDWVRDAFGHLKVIGVVGDGCGLLAKAGIARDAGVVEVDGQRVAGFVTAAKQGRVWDREPSLRQ